MQRFINKIWSKTNIPKDSSKSKLGVVGGPIGHPKKKGTWFGLRQEPSFDITIISRNIPTVAQKEGVERGVRLILPWKNDKCFVKGNNCIPFSWIKVIVQDNTATVTATTLLRNVLKKTITESNIYLQASTKSNLFRNSIFMNLAYSEIAIAYCDLILASPTILSMTPWLRKVIFKNPGFDWRMSWAVKAGRKTKFKASLQNLLNTRIGAFRYPLHTGGWVKTRKYHCFIIVQQSKGERGRATAPRLM